MKKELTLKKFYSMLVKREGKKHQATYGDTEEIGCGMLDLAAEKPEVEFLILKEIFKRKLKLAKKKK